MLKPPRDSAPGGGCWVCWLLTVFGLSALLPPLGFVVLLLGLLFMCVVYRLAAVIFRDGPRSWLRHWRNPNANGPQNRRYDWTGVPALGRFRALACCQGVGKEIGVGKSRLTAKPLCDSLKLEIETSPEVAGKIASLLAAFDCGSWI